MDFIGNFMEYFRLAVIWNLKRQKMPQTILAARTNLSKQFVNNIVKGHKYGTEKTRRKIAEALGTNYETLLKFGEKLFIREQEKKQS